ncbi:MAG TPA: DUF5011 domain-containing protein [Clostridiales bacterium]|nr:DUF5011 domain-containing protein [Clostridiales bacterium]
MARRRGIGKGLFIIILAAAAVMAVKFFFFSDVYKSVTLEAGADIFDISHYLRNPKAKAVFASNTSAVDASKPGVYEIQIKVGRRIYKTELTIVDTIPPKAETINQTITFGDTIEAQAFVTNISDATQVQVSYKNQPDFNLLGDQTVTLILEDAGKNITELTAVLSISMVHDTVLVGIGANELNINDFLISDEFTGSFVTDISAINLNEPGQYEVIIEIDGKRYTSQLKIVDLTPPAGEVVSQEMWVNDEIEADKFVKNIVDHSPVKVYYKENPDFSKPGTQDVVIVLEDENGNKTELTASLTLIEDTEPPVIRGNDEVYVYIGDKVSYRKQVIVDDNRDDSESIALDIDSSSVNLKKSGTYTVTYKATDSSGNTAEKKVSFIVRERPEDYVTIKEVDAMADQILESIIIDNMTPREKARAIYVWIRSNVRYDNNYENNTDWVKAAYDAFTKKKGDCYVFFGAAKELLTRAGIENMDIVKTGGGHYWNMVNIDGWYHYDATPRRTGGEFFMMTDAELEAYSRKYGNSHIWDRNKYPATPQK